MKDEAETVLNWVLDNQEASTEELKDKKKEFEEFMMKHIQANMPQNPTPEGMPTQSPPQSDDKGPTIEEVD